MNHIEHFPTYINYDACDNRTYSTTQDHSRQQKKHLRQNHNPHDSRRHPHHHDPRYTGPDPDAIFKDYSSTCYSQPQSIDPSLILDPLYETTPVIYQEYAQEYAYAATTPTTHNVCYAMPRGISPSSSDSSSIRSMDSWRLHNMSSMSSPASSISSRHPSPIPEQHPRPSTHSTKSSHLRVQTGSVAIPPSVISPRHAKRTTPYPDSEDGPDGKKRWACHDCGKKFTRDSDRKRHCDESTSCPKKAKVYDEIDCDIRFSCEYCQKQFSRYDSLERHRKNPTACTGRPKVRY